MIEELLEAEIVDVLGRDYYRHHDDGDEPSPRRGYRNGHRTAKLASAEGAGDAGGDAGREERQVNQTLIEALAKAHRWQQQIESGRFAGLDELAAFAGVDRSYVGRLLRLTSLAPDIVEAILRGDEPTTNAGRAVAWPDGGAVVNWLERRDELSVGEAAARGRGSRALRRRLGGGVESRSRIRRAAGLKIALAARAFGATLAAVRRWKGSGGRWEE